MSGPQTVCCLRAHGHERGSLRRLVGCCAPATGAVKLTDDGDARLHTAAHSRACCGCCCAAGNKTVGHQPVIASDETATRHCFQSHPIQYLASASNRCRICFVFAMKTKRKISFSALFPLKGSTSNPSPMRTPLPSSSLDVVSTSLGACPFFLREAGGICQCGDWRALT